MLDPAGLSFITGSVQNLGHHGQNLWTQPGARGCLVQGPLDFLSALCPVDFIESQDLQLGLRQFVAGLRVSTAKSQAMVLDRRNLVRPL